MYIYRYDDTNPEAEKKEYIDHIEEIITYSSDYFQELYELAVELIRRGHAYVDHLTPDEIKEYREKKMNSPWRDRPMEESLKLFDDMKKELIEEGKATLRMKQDMKSDNFNMYDLIAYRIKFTPHPHAGDKWCIYPSYDFTHCIVDSLENITHSVVITNMEASVMELDAKKWPDAPADNVSSFYKVPFSKVVYIEKSDFRMKDSKDYYGLAPGKSVLLRYAFPIKCIEVILGDKNDTIVEIHAEYDPSKMTKPKNPAELEDKWLDDLNPNSKIVISDAYAVPSLNDAAVGDSFQFERLGYFVVDKDSTPGKLVFNRTVTLRDSYSK
ncbi:glutamine--tRNA ligase [Striga asiatica]|uniref:glutamine--tRNA ligase n=1 Tax=Striga asiatica TaxID=4170 RepID=A0A5A7QB58_STRAF|nr:glutamine--tRNA ligase [Striga asiatica]